MEWTNDIRKFSSGKILLLGKWNVASVFYDGCRSKDDPKAYRVTCSLPGIKTDLGNFENESEAMIKVEEAVRYWVDKSADKTLRRKS